MPQIPSTEAPADLAPLAIGHKEDADLYGTLEEMARYYEEHPPGKARLGSGWQGYARLLVCHWVTFVAMLGLLIGIKVTGLLPGSEAFAADYDTSRPTVVGQIAVDWTLQPFVALSVQLIDSQQGVECQEGLQ